MEKGSSIYDRSRDAGSEYLVGEALRRSKELAVAGEVRQVLENPDKTESFELYNSGEPGRMIALVGGEFGVRADQASGKPKEVTAKLFKPHDTVQERLSVLLRRFKLHKIAQGLDENVLLDVHTSVVAFGTRRICVEDGIPSGEKVSLLFFKLSANVSGEPTPPMTVEDLNRKTSTYGAVVSDSGIEYFEFTEDCDVKKVSSINSPLDTSLEKIELKEELEKFVQSRQGMVASDGD